MSDYHPPVQNIMFLLHDVLGFSHEELDRETVEAVLDEAAKLASGILAPLNKSGDEQGASLNGQDVKTAQGFKEAYKQYCEGGWNAVPFDPEYGGQGLPWAIAFPVQEMWQGANMSFGLCPLLNQGAVEAISAHGTDEQKDYFLPKLITGEWTGTMNLTESQAGSDLGLLNARAERQDNGTYKITGQKIFITYGEHDMAENIIHLVLARLPGAPDDVRGISLFIAPKILEDGTRNSLSCIGLEHKLGIHASPTCTMDFDSATGYLLGKEHEGLKCMFTMMNNARLSVGLQGVAIAEHALQHAQNYAAERIQGKSFETGQRVTIKQHPDIRRTLLSMRSYVEAGRALTYEAALALDAAAQGDTCAKAKADLLTPIVKSWCTDMAVEVASLGLQVHGGMGFIEETGAAQYYRDARILPIYEGTNGIQAQDLVFRKVLHDQGEAASSYIKNMQGAVEEDILDTLSKTTSDLLKKGNDKDMEALAWAASPYLKALGIIAGGAWLEKIAKTAKNNSALEKAFQQEKQDNATFYRHNILPLAAAHLKSVYNS